jgi:hypothetical protein
MQGSRVRRVRWLGRLPLAGAAVLLLAFASTYAAPPRAQAAPSGSLTMSPGNSSINVNDTIGITFDVSGGASIHRVLLTVTYNPVVVSPVDADGGTPGTQILPGAFPGTTGDGTVLQNSASAGTITYEYALAGNDEATGSGTVATVQFQAIAVGNANISWSTVQFTDGAGVNATPPGGTAANLMVGQAVATSTPQATFTPTETGTPTETSTPAPTDTPVPGATDTATPTATETPDGTVTETPTGTPSVSPTPAPGTPTKTGTATTVPATATPRITVLEDSNKAKPPQSGIDPAQSDRANGLPSAGSTEQKIKWWRWMFFAAALMLAVAGWFFTFAIHYGDKEPILVDRFDRRRRRKY